MAAPTLASSASFADTGNNTTRTINKPSGTASGDWLYLFVSIDGTASITTPTGFTQIFYRVDPASNMRLGIYEREADGTEGSTFTIDTASEIACGWIVRVTGADSTAALDVMSAWQGELNGIISVGLAPTPEAYAACSDGSLILQAAAFDNGTGTFSATPSGYTSLGEVGANSSGTSLAVAHKQMSSQGYVGTASWTYGTNTEQGILVTLVIRASATTSFPAQPVIRCMETHHQPTLIAPVVNKPYGTVDNDLLLLVQSADSTLTIPAGFTSIQSTNNAAAIYHAAHYKIASSEGSTYTCGTTAAPLVALMRVTGAATSSPIDTSSSATGTSTSPAASTITPSVDNCTIIYSMACDDDEVTTNGGTPSTFTNVFAESNDDGSDVGIIIARKEQTTATATGSITGSFTASEEWVAFAFAIKPLANVNVEGDIAATLANLTPSMNAKNIVKATLANTLANITPSMTGYTGISAYVINTLANIAPAIVAELVEKGAITANLANVTPSMQARAKVKAQVSATLANTTASMQALVHIVAAVVATLAGVTPNMQVRNVVKAQLAAALASVNPSMQAIVALDAVINATLADASCAAEADLIIKALINSTLQATISAMQAQAGNEVAQSAGQFAPFIANQGQLTVRA